MQIVPQYIDVEDKIAGPFTWKHIGWFFAGGTILAALWNLVDKTTFYLAAVPIVIVTFLLAFYRPNGVALITFIGYGFTYLFRPKVYTWQNEVVKPPKKTDEQKQRLQKKEERQLSTEDVAALASTLDTRGVDRSERIQKIIRERAKQK